MENTQVLKVPGARGKIEVTGVNGIFYKILIDGEPLKPVKGRWLIPTRDGGNKEMRTRGFIPGFQRIFVEGEKIFDMAEDVTMGQRVMMFLPLVLILINPWIGMVLAIVLFFLHVTLMKNPVMPKVLRYVLPITNTLAAALVLLVLGGVIGGA